MDSAISRQIRGSRSSHVIREFLGNSAHFPIANILLEMLIEGVGNYIRAPDLYAILLSCVAQAYFLGSMQFRGTPRPLVGNLIGPALYTLIEFSVEGTVFFQTANHIAYWVFALAIGGLQQVRLALPPGRGSVFILLENLTRTYILLAGYWIFEVRSEAAYGGRMSFFDNDSHLFVFWAVSLIGLVVGLANVNAARYESLLQQVATKLRVYSEWLLGRSLLDQAVSDPSAMSLKRRERVVVFADIRGFTQWSEAMPPEQVVTLLNRYFEAAEKVWQRYPLIKVKLTGDEIMVVLDSPQPALDMARALLDALMPLLSPEGLSAGVGIHSGPLVEGLMGSQEVKGYDVIGDTVNTAKRLCDHAAGGEILLSRQACDGLKTGLASEPEWLKLKGKQAPFGVFRLTQGRAA